MNETSNMRRSLFILWLAVAAGIGLTDPARASGRAAPDAVAATHKRLPHAHHRHAHSVAAPNLVARTVRGSAPSVPATPHRRRNHHSATVPHAVHRLPSPRSFKSGGHAPLALSSFTAGHQAFGWWRSERTESDRVTRERAAM